jgi:pyrroloquinoline quinone (PQQ) biosynthesis protein C
MSLFFETLIKATESEKQALFQVPQIRAALHGQISKATYLAYLEQAYHHVKHTVPLMMAAGSRLTERNEFLREALVEYVKEEVGHQEWILNDIQHTGGDAARVRHDTPSEATEIMVAFAYDYVSRINPVGFFGMVFVLEGTSTQLATQAADTLQQTLGLSHQSVTYLSSHGELDVSHMQFFASLMNQISNPSDQQAIIHMAKRMFVLFANMFRSIPFDQSDLS